MPSFGGSAIFGFAVKMATGDIELRRQENEYPGLNGVESLTQGTSGLYTEAEGVLTGPSAADLSTAEGTFRGYKDGSAYSLVDNFGVAWSNVLLDSFMPQGKVRQDGAGNFLRPYKARFRHLTTA